uniref:Uncharacterized protein n=1 Tax=Hippocampus comes TaxID=109280 RepID=A0A3Q2YZU4_HIPCM
YKCPSHHQPNFIEGAIMLNDCFATSGSGHIAVIDRKMNDQVECLFETWDSLSVQDLLVLFFLF